MKKYTVIISLFLLFLFVLELYLRIYWGFCDSILMREDPDFEYIAQPMQNRYRFRNHVNYNEFSMRSETVDTTSIVFLGLGDSIINGGAQTDHDSLATTIISKKLSENSNKKVQFLNISAGSWGPDNCYAYIKKYGHFNAKAIVLFVSSHDAYDNMNFDKIIDVHESFPSIQYSSAIVELFDRYLMPRIKNYFPAPVTNQKINELGINKKENESKFNTGFNLLFQYSKDNNLPFYICLHAEKSELEVGNYNQQGQEIIQFARSKNIPILLELDCKFTTNCYRDGIHINAKGQKMLVKYLMPMLEENL